jgi:cation:H+ antiporter
MLTYLLFVTGFVFLIKGADFLVDGASSIAKYLNVSDLAIGLTVVAFGTSMPELFVNLIASFKGNTEIAIGNVLGSNIANIFNIFFVLGMSATIRPLPFQMRNNVDLSMVIFSSLMLFFFMFTGKRRSLERWEGIVCLILYFGYVAFLIVYEQ